MLHGILRFDGHPSMMMGFLINIERIGPHIRFALWESSFVLTISINITSPSSPLVQTSLVLEDWGTNPSDSKNELSLRTFFVMNEIDRPGGLSLDHSFLGWIVMALIEPWIWVEHCGSSVGPSNTVSSFVGVILTLLLFKIGFKLGQSSVSQSLLHLRNLPLYTYRYNQLCSPAMALRGAEMMRYLRETHDPDYVPEPIHPEYILLEGDHEFPAEEQPLPPVDSPPGLKAEVDRLLARTTPSPSPHISLLPPSAEERLARVTKLADSMEHDTQTFMHTRDAQDNDSLWRLVMEWWTEEAYASQEAWAHSIRLSTSISTTNETRVSDCSMAELARHFEKTDHQTSGPDGRDSLID
ncbi:hypothetical protein Tco_1176939 [Tanacetum coccineum]